MDELRLVMWIVVLYSLYLPEASSTQVTCAYPFVALLTSHDCVSLGKPNFLCETFSLFVRFHVVLDM